MIENTEIKCLLLACWPWVPSSPSLWLSLGGNLPLACGVMTSLEGTLGSAVRNTLISVSALWTLRVSSPSLSDVRTSTDPAPRVSASWLSWTLGSADADTGGRSWVVSGDLWVSVGVDVRGAGSRSMSWARLRLGRSLPAYAPFLTQYLIRIFQFSSC